MAEASDTRGILRQNLRDAGCDEKTIKACMDCAEKGDWEQLALLLSRQKHGLLESVHASRKQIDCLDFLVYQIEKEHQQEE